MLRQDSLQLRGGILKSIFITIVMFLVNVLTEIIPNDPNQQ